MNAPERFEQLIAYLGSNLPSPTEQHDEADGSMQFIAGDPPEVIVVLTETSVIVSEFTAVWETPYVLTPRPRRVGVLKWRRLPETALFNALAALVKGAREARAAQYRACEQCGRSTPPEWLLRGTVCHLCSQRELVH